MSNEKAAAMTEDEVQQTVKEALGKNPTVESHTPADVININDGSKVATPAAETHKHEATLDLLMDIPLSLAVELGRTRIKIADLLKLGQGSVLELNKLSGESLDIIVNDKMLARGEVVVVNEKFGVRITEIVSQTERVEQLR